jgi:hypothetical protein
LTWPMFRLKVPAPIHENRASSHAGPLQSTLHATNARFHNLLPLRE